MTQMQELRKRRMAKNENEYLFRGKDKKTDKWVYGDLTHTQGLDASNPSFTYPRTMVAGYEVDKETIGQFTGMYDKKGMKIYIGDIVYVEYDDKSNAFCLVGWNEKELAVGVMHDYAYMALLEGNDYPAFDNHILLGHYKHAYRFEVVGNIIENPNLLKRE